MKIKVSDYIIKFIQSKGVNDIFMLAGGGCIHLVDSVKNNGMNYTCNLHQQAASIAAEAYSQYTNNFGVCLVTTGPGGTNAITGCTAAWLQSTPVMFISGQVNTKDMRKNNGYPRQYGFQEINITDMVTPIVKYTTTITSPEQTSIAIKYAYYQMMNGRKGPVWIDVPLDIQSSMIQDDIDVDIDYTFCVENNYNREYVSGQIIKELQLSKCPVLLVGNGVRLSNSNQQLLKLIQVLKIPVLTTWKMIDVITEQNQYYVGRPGIIAQKHANIIQQESDLIICIGARLDLGQIAFSPQTFGSDSSKKIIIDIDNHQLDKLNRMKNTRFIQSDAKYIIDKLLLQTVNYIPKHDDWMMICKQIVKKYPTDVTMYEDFKPVNLYNFIKKLSEVIPDDAIIVVGSSGTCSQVTFQSLQLKGNQRIINTHGLGSMGFAIPAAIGVSVASNKPVYCIQGDGSFAMNIQQLALINNLKNPIKFFIINNNGYLSIRNTQNGMFQGNLIGSEDHKDLQLLDIQKQSNAYDIQYTRCNNNDYLWTSILKVVLNKKSIICQLMCDQFHKTLPRTIVKKKQNGQFYTLPMQNLIQKDN